jgi:hypothetical protein
MAFAEKWAGAIDFAGYDPAEGMKRPTIHRTVCRFLRRTQARLVILCARPKDGPKLGT